jgi:hypothetical protein
VAAELFAHDAGADLLHRPRRQGAQLEGAVGQPDQTVDGQAQGLEHLADLPVLALDEGEGDPQVRALRPLLGLVQTRLDGAVADALDGQAVL